MTAVGSTRREYGLGSAVGVLRGMMTSKTQSLVRRLKTELHPESGRCDRCLGSPGWFQPTGMTALTGRPSGPSWRISKASDAVFLLRVPNEVAGRKNRSGTRGTIAVVSDVFTDVSD